MCVDEETMDRIDATTTQQRFEAHFPTASPVAIDLLMRLLCYVPSQRIKPTQGMRHEYCAQFHDEESDGSAQAPVSSQPTAALPNIRTRAAFLDKMREEDRMRELESITDNTKRSTADYRGMLYGICEAQAQAVRS